MSGGGWQGTALTTVNPPNSCAYCGPYVHHVGICPRVEEIEYHPNGTIKRVKLKVPGETVTRSTSRFVNQTGE